MSGYPNPNTTFDSYYSSNNYNNNNNNNPPSPPPPHYNNNNSNEYYQQSQNYAVNDGYITNGSNDHYYNQAPAPSYNGMQQTHSNLNNLQRQPTYPANHQIVDLRQDDLTKR